MSKRIHLNCNDIIRKTSKKNVVNTFSKSDTRVIGLSQYSVKTRVGSVKRVIIAQLSSGPNM